MELPPPTHMPPAFLLSQQNGKHLLIGVDGELVWLDEELKASGQVCSVFPTPITLATQCGDVMVGTWVDHGMMTARLAALDLTNVFAKGVSREELRRSFPSQRGHSLHVSGADWSHSLDAEPMAICSEDDHIAFALWKRGVYCIRTDSSEIWRRENPTWEKLSNLPRGGEVVAMNMVDEGVILWSRGGGWVRFEIGDGEMTESGVLELPEPLDSVFHHAEGGWLLCAGEIVARLSDLNANPILAKVSGAVGDAAWDEEILSWRLTGWREDIQLGDDAVKRTSRPDLGVRLILHEQRWLVLDNRGYWSTHLSE